MNLYSGVERRETLAFNPLHKKDNARTQNKRFCSEENVEVPWQDVVKGYEHAKGQYVVVTDEDFEKARVPATQTFDIRAFVPAGEVAETGRNGAHLLWPVLGLPYTLPASICRRQIRRVSPTSSVEGLACERIESR